MAIVVVAAVVAVAVRLQGLGGGGYWHRCCRGLRAAVWCANQGDELCSVLCNEKSCCVV